MRNTRRLVQIISFALFIALLFLAIVITDPPEDSNFAQAVSRYVPADLFPRMSPLGAATTLAASDEIRGGIAEGNTTPLLDHLLRYLPAGIVLLAGIVMGRFFCSWVCPLGTTLDATDKLCSSARNTGKATSLYDGRRLKIYLLIAVIIAALLGVQIAGWFDPLSIVTRSYAMVVHPWLVRMANGFFGLLHNVPGVNHLTDPVHDAVQAVLHAHQQPSHITGWVFGLMLAGIAAFGLVLPRYWCRNLCPLGAMLSLVSGWSIFKRRVSDACIECGKCTRSCPMGAIGEDGKTTKAGECTLCMTCQAVCPTEAISFGSEQPMEQAEAVDITRRGLITSAAAGAVAVPMLRVSAAGRLGSGGEAAAVIRPPGARPEDEFLDRCVRCGECMRACKTNGLQPVWFEAGLEGMWTPRLVPRLGYCDRNCTVCGNVCPSQAIRALTFDEKKHLALGKARFNRNACIPWVGWSRFKEDADQWQDCNCAVCEEVCPIPTKAIRFNTFKSTVGGEEIEIRRPYVEEDLCTGCGFCEKVCPVEGSAIKVIPMRNATAKVEEAPTAAGADTAAKFPKVIGKWRLSKEVTVYPADDLFEYINGGAPPYQSYDLQFVAVASYVHEDNQKEVRADIWEFASSDDAYGVFLKDSAEVERLEGIGTEAAGIQTTCWAWKGEYWLWIQPGRNTASPEEARMITKAIADALPAEDAQPPDLVKRLPDKNRRPNSQSYFHKAINFSDVYFLDDKTVFGLSEKTNVAASTYQTDAGSYPLAIIEYSNNAEATAAAKRFEAYLKQSCEQEPSTGTIKVWKKGDDAFFLAARSGRYLLAAFRSPDRDGARETMQKAIENLGN